jgi:catechol 2,3-dioxygenase-like lactoylglutathione lyase family enzyme
MLVGVPRLDVVGVIVSDLRRATDFYQRLGLEFPDDLDPEGHGHVETTLPGGLRFTLDTQASIQSFDRTGRHPWADRLSRLPSAARSPSDVDRVLATSSTCSRRSRADAFPASAVPVGD